MITEFARGLGLRVPLIQAPMAGVSDFRLAIAVARAGGLGSLPCAFLDNGQIQSEVARFRGEVDAPLNLNFFCHSSPREDPADQLRWREALEPFYQEYGIGDADTKPGPTRRAFDEEAAAIVLELKPQVVSFHFGLPAEQFLAEVKKAGATILSSATTVEEAVWLADHGADAIIAQGLEAGGHRGMFLEDTLANQPATMDLLAEILAIVDLPVIAAGGLGSSEDVQAALATGAAAVQLGTAFLLCPETNTSELHRLAIREATEQGTVVTNLFSGRPARSVSTELTRKLGPISDAAPPFPNAGTHLGPLRNAAERAGRYDFTPVWSGSNTSAAREMPAEAVVRELFG